MVVFSSPIQTTCLAMTHTGEAVSSYPMLISPLSRPTPIVGPDEVCGGLGMWTREPN